MPMTLGFPKNTEMEAELTFVRQPGAGGPGGGGGRGGMAAVAVRFSKGRQRCGHRGSRKHPRASFDSRATRRQLQAAQLRSTRRLRRFVVRELRRPAWPADDAALHPASPVAEERSVREGERSGQADHLLPRSRRTRSDSLGAARWRALVEPGVRSGRLSQRVSGRAAARRRQPRTFATTSSTGFTVRHADGAPGQA